MDWMLAARSYGMMDFLVRCHPFREILRYPDEDVRSHPPVHRFEVLSDAVQAFKLHLPPFALLRTPL